MNDLYYPLRSLREGHWFKLICGASFQHLPTIRNLALAYALAGADCIDVAADPAVILAAKTALDVASQFVRTSRQQSLHHLGLPWLMVSFNDGEDPHFRKAEFDPANCPVDCPRPCEAVCPAQAIVFQSNALGDAARERSQSSGFSGVVDARCYGCGRCLPICPVQHISTRSYVSTPAAVASLVLQTEIDAIEIHTQVGRVDAFRQLWAAIAPWTHRLKLVAISCPDGDGLIDYLWTLYQLISPLPCALIWQTDGRPMSGDIGVGATRAAVKLGQKVLTAGLPGYVQLAGGTNDHTVPKLRALGLLPRGPHLCGSASRDQAQHSRSTQPSYISGIAYGSYARTLVSPILNQLETGITNGSTNPRPVAHLLAASRTATVLDSAPEAANTLSSNLEESALLWEAVNLAASLVSQIKSPSLDRTFRTDQ